jgi:virginiamycin B lyase
MTEFALPGSGAPLGITAGMDGFVWVTVPVAHAICRLGPDGRVVAFFLPETMTPAFITSGADGNLWFSEPSGRIGRFTPAGNVTEFAAAPAAGETAKAEIAPTHTLLIGSP